MMWLIIFVLAAAIPARSQCAGINGQTTASGGITLNCVTGVTPPPPPPTLAIPPQACPQAIEGTQFSCTINAVGGTLPYSWSSSGTLPAGLTRTNNAITGTPSAAGTSAYSMTVTDSASPPATASIQLTLTVVAAGACGFPTYSCARSDWNAFAIDTKATVPPTAGSQTDGGPLHACAPGDNASGLPACSNRYGINTIITEPDYANVRILRVTDYNDRNVCGGAMTLVGGGGNASQNVFDSSGQYFRAGNCIKWLDTAAFQINTCAHRGLSPPDCSPAGYVLNPDGTVFYNTTPAIFASFVTPGEFYVYPSATSPLITTFIITNGVVGPSSTVSDLSYGVPCWQNLHANSNVPMCGNWTQGNYQPGSVLCPGCADPVLPVKNSGRCNRATATPVCFHSFSLVNTAACATGASEPDWNLAFSTPSANWMTVVQDGQCQWADMGPPVSQNGAGVRWSSAAMHDVTDNYFNRGLSNWGGQDQAGACFVVTYARSQNTFYHLNTCTGAIYTMTCSVAAYTCAGGTQTSTYEGNLFLTPWNASLETRRFQMHSADMGQSPNWVIPSHNNCALKDVPFAITSISLSGTSATYTYTPEAGQPPVAVGNIVAISGTSSGVSGHAAMFNVSAVGTGDPIPPTGTGVVTAATSTTFSLTLPVCTGSNVTGCVPAGQPAIGPLAQTNATSIRWVECQRVTGTTATQNLVPWYWYPLLGPSHSIDAFSMLGTSAPGHTTRGYDTYIYDTQTNYVLFKYMGFNVTNFAANTGTGISQPVGVPGNAQNCSNVRNANGITFYPCKAGYFNLMPNLPNHWYPNAAPRSGNDCFPLECAGPYTPPAPPAVCNATGNPTGSICSLARKVGWDQHTSWVTNRGGAGDLYPVCMEAYSGNWPWQSPWTGEVTCYATDGSNRVAREAQTYNTMTVSNLSRNGTGGSASMFVVAAMVGQYSQDGRYWTFNSNWFCTLGTRTGTADPALCGFPFQRNHAYQLGDLVGPNTSQNTSNGNQVGSIYEVTTAGVSSDHLPCATATATTSSDCSTNYWCAATPAAAPGCTFTNGTATFTFRGPSNEEVSVFLVELK